MRTYVRARTQLSFGQSESRASRVRLSSVDQRSRTGQRERVEEREGDRETEGEGGSNQLTMAMVECSGLWSVVCLTLSSIRYTVRLVYLASAAKASNFLLQAPPTTHHCFPSCPSPPLSASRSASWMDTQRLAWWFDGRFWVSGSGDGDGWIHSMAPELIEVRLLL